MTAAPPVRSRPAPGAPRDYRFPRFERRALSNGLRLIVAPVPKLPIVTVAAVFDAGAICDPDGREGLAELTVKLLLEGTTTSDGAELIDRFERLGASVDASADWDSAAVTMTALAENLAPAFAILAEVLRMPAFREREVERLKSERLAELLQLRTEPRGLADELFTRFLYEPSSRYSRPDGGDEESVKSIDRNDVRSFFETRYVPSMATVLVVGDITVRAAEDLVASTLGVWSGASPRRVTASDRPARSERAVHIVTKPDAPQSELRVGQVGIPRKHPDYFPAVVMNAILGGLFNSRINLNLREAHGYTYGAFSGFEWRRQSGPFTVSTAVKSEVTDAAAREVISEIDRMRSTLVDEEELSLATSYLDGVFPIRYETTAAIAAALANLVVYDLPDDYFDRYRDNVRAVTREAVLQAAEQHLAPSALQMVVVGDPETVQGPLDAIGFGPVRVYDAQGRPVE
jgi:predicted Zn-dependent peptidase